VLKDGPSCRSRREVVDPDTMLEKFGADALRLYVMFVAPPENQWSGQTLGSKELPLPARVWRLVVHWGEVGAALQESMFGMREFNLLEFGSLTPAERAVRRKTHDTIRA